MDYFQGPKKDPNAAKEFIKEMFLEPIAEPKTVYSHFTCATDTRNIKVIFDSVKDTILEKFMKEFIIN